MNDTIYQVRTCSNAYQLPALLCYHWIMSHVGLICNQLIVLYMAF